MAMCKQCLAAWRSGPRTLSWVFVAAMGPSSGLREVRQHARRLQQRLSEVDEERNALAERLAADAQRVAALEAQLRRLQEERRQQNECRNAKHHLLYLTDMVDERRRLITKNSHLHVRGAGRRDRR